MRVGGDISWWVGRGNVEEELNVEVNDCAFSI